jgi:hypothetical protein
LSIADLIALKFAPPELAARFWEPAPVLAPMAVPKTTVYKHDLFSRGEYNIGASWQY